MKRKILLGIFMSVLTGLVSAQQKKITAFAVTGAQKGGGSWNEVRLVDISTGDEVKLIYKSANEVEILNARTGKPVVKKDLAETQEASAARPKKAVVTITDDRQVIKMDPSVQNLQYSVIQDVAVGQGQNRKTIYVRSMGNSTIRSDKPFATNSAAMAYDARHERLYYTPMGIAELRFIDLKSGKIYYFENEKFGQVKGMGDAPNQITRMVIASDGDGYALTNDGNHLIRFTTGKKPVITDLGAVSDATGNTVSVHNGAGFGGDMIADANKNLYLITANRHVFRISLETKVADYLGAIKGLPRGFSTNGAIAEGGSSVIVCSSNSTQGYFKFDLNTLESEKVSGGAPVFNASDLANGVLAFAKEKKRKERKQPEVLPEPVPPTPVETVLTEKAQPQQTVEEGSFSLYPNPVRVNGTVRLSFANQPAGKYQVQLIDISGKLISSRQVTISNRAQIEELRIPRGISKGSYLVRVTGITNKVNQSSTIVVGE